MGRSKPRHTHTLGHHCEPDNHGTVSCWGLLSAPASVTDLSPFCRTLRSVLEKTYNDKASESSLVRLYSSSHQQACGGWDTSRIRAGHARGKAASCKDVGVPSRSAASWRLRAGLLHDPIAARGVGRGPETGEKQVLDRAAADSSVGPFPPIRDLIGAVLEGVQRVSKEALFLPPSAVIPALGLAWLRPRSV